MLQLLLFFSRSQFFCLIFEIFLKFITQFFFDIYKNARHFYREWREWAPGDRERERTKERSILGARFAGVWVVRQAWNTSILDWYTVIQHTYIYGIYRVTYIYSCLPGNVRSRGRIRSALAWPDFIVLNRKK